MDKYISVPLYKDAACTEFYKNFNIIIINKEAFDAQAQLSYQYLSDWGRTVQANYPRRSPNGTLDFGSLGGNYAGTSPDSKETTISVMNLMHAQIAAHICSEMAIYETIYSKFSLLSLYNGLAETYYFKNGSTLSFLKSSEHSSGATLKKLTITCRNGSTTLSKTVTLSATPMTLGWAQNASYPAFNGDVVKETINAVDRRSQYGNYGFNVVFFTFDNNDNLSWRSVNDTYKITNYRGKDYTGPNDTAGPSVRDTSCVMSGKYPLFERFFSDILGLGNVTGGTPEDIINKVGGEIKNNLPDDEGTYPGGGEDLNTYPEDDDGQNTSGHGAFDNTNDPIDFPGMPLWDATSTGFISMWNPTVLELIDLYGFLWDSEISTTLKKLFLEPMDAIISLALFPVDPINFEGKRAVSIGHVDTGITMNAVQKQFVDFDFGTLKLDEYYGAAWDYSPYTKVSIYLPYIGSQELDVDDVMNATLHLKYRIDLLSGMCVAMLKASRGRDGLDAVVYTWQGNCAMQIPITAGGARDFLNSIIQLGAMTGLALTQPAAGAISSAMHAKDENHENTSMGNNWVNPTMATYNALNVLGQKVHVQRGGRVDANAGVMSPQSAYIIVNRPISAIPRGWNEYAGYPSLKVKNLSTQKGHTQVAYIKLNGLEATAREISELDGILKGGVIL